MFNSMKKLKDHLSIEHPILNLSCKDTGCEYKTNKAQSLAVHSKEIHERNVYANLVIQ